MKAIDFTVSEHNSVSIVFFISFIRYSKGADMDDRYPAGVFLHLLLSDVLGTVLTVIVFSLLLKEE